MLALGLLSCASSQPVWFAPNLASRDMLRLFTHPEEWKETRKRVGVFQFYAAQLGAADECPDCGGNDLAQLQAASAFQRLKGWGIDTAVEAPAIKGWGCIVELTLPVAERVVSRVAAAGGEIRHLAMDESLLGGEECGQWPDATADEVASYVSSLRRAHPRLTIGDIEPYPHLDAELIVDWLDALAARGAPIEFLHIDVDRVRAALLEKDVPGDLARLRDACAQRGVSFGVVFWGGDGLDEAGYAADVLPWVDSVRSAIGPPAHLVFQSWSASADGRREVPINLPEESTTVWSHTRLTREGLKRLGEAP